MNLFEFCLEIIRREGEKFNVGINTTTASQITAATAVNVNYDIAHNRCAYLYRCGAINLSFAKDCFSKFFSDYKSFVFLLSKWISCPNLTVCSLSKGPAFDYIAFLLAYQESGRFPYLFKNIKVISKYGAWRNTVNIMHQVVTEGFLKSLQVPVLIGNIEVIQGDPFVDFSQKVKDPISNSDVIIMMKTLNLQADCNDKYKITKSVQEFLAALKPDAILFCMDTKPSIGLITEEILSFPGAYLLNPTFMNTSISLDHADFYKDIFGCFPVISARGSFFVWQKSSLTSSSHLDYLMDEVSESVKRLLKIKNDDHFCNKLSEKSCDSENVATFSSKLSSNYFTKDFSIPNGSSKSVDLESLNNDIILTDPAVKATGSSNSPSTSSSQSIITCEYREENGFTKKKSSYCISADKSIQTEPEINFKSAESVKIASLIERVKNLTLTLTNLIETSELKSLSTDSNCLEHVEGACKCSIPVGHIPSNCPSHASCLHNCDCIQENTLSNHTACKQSCLTCNHHSSSVSLNNDNEIIRNQGTPYEREFSVEKNSVPKLVIPLNNLPVDVATKIISLIAQSNKNS